MEDEVAEFRDDCRFVLAVKRSDKGKVNNSSSVERDKEPFLGTA